MRCVMLEPVGGGPRSQDDEVCIFVSSACGNPISIIPHVSARDSTATTKHNQHCTVVVGSFTQRKKFVTMTTLLRLTAKKVSTGSNASKLSRFASRSLSTVPEWASCNPWELGTSNDSVHEVLNCVDGKWTGDTKSKMTIPHPLDRDAPPIFTIPDTQEDELAPFFESLRKCPKTGLHNPLKNPERYVQYGEITRRVCFKY